MKEIHYQSATTLARMIRRRHLSVTEVMHAHIARIEQINPQINALVSLQLEQALAEAGDADKQLAKGCRLGPLYGLPIAHKDSFLTRGLRTSFGSKVFEHNIPTQDSAVVAKQRAAGAIIVGKTNLPEFGAGSHTFNSLFGVTRNPYMPSVSAGGSSGGSAAALAAGMVALADGSDMGGSLRNPASFCNVVGLRPSIGRVPMAPGNHPFNLLTVGGPMGRCVADVALLLKVMSGESSGDPLAHAASVDDFYPVGRVEPEHMKIAISRTLGGLPFEPEVLAALDKGIATLQDMQCTLEESEPDFDGADLAFDTFRALAFATNYGQLNTEQRALLKETVRWNIDLGLTLSGQQVAEAGRAHGLMFNRMQRLMQDFDFLVAPVSQVVPFPVEQEYPTCIDGVAMPNYISWMRSCSRITATGHPAISLPCGFTNDGKPIGIQIVGQFQQEHKLLAFAQMFEHALPCGRRRPAFN